MKEKEDEANKEVSKANADASKKATEKLDKANEYSSAINLNQLP